MKARAWLEVGIGEWFGVGMWVRLGVELEVGLVGLGVELRVSEVADSSELGMGVWLVLGVEPKIQDVDGRGGDCTW